jgi:hypothetical protein
MLMLVESSAADRGGPARRVLASTTSLVANILLDMLLGLGSAHTSSEVAANFILELKRGDGSRAG